MNPLRRDLALILIGSVMAIGGTLLFGRLTEQQSFFSFPGVIAILGGGFLATSAGIGLGMCIAGAILIVRDAIHVGTEHRNLVDPVTELEE